jgi:N-acyl homoserine lactone hydrolase
MNLKIHPLHLGTLTSFDKSLFTFLRNHGIKLDVPCLAWLILGGESPILVDTGPCDPGFAARYHRPMTKTAEQEIDAALGRFGLRPADLRLIIYTHLHWDHCFNGEKFPGATFFIQKAELNYAVAPLPTDWRTYGIGRPGVPPPWMKVFGQMKVLEGDGPVAPGVRVLLLPGHTPGSQGVVVETNDGPWVIAGDTVPLYETMEGEPGLKPLPSSIYQNLFDYWSSLKKLEAFGKKVLPGHDAGVLVQDRYPT